MSKKNIAKLKEQMKKLQAQMRQVERNFYVVFAKQVEKEIASDDCTVEKLKSLYESLRKEYGL